MEINIDNNKEQQNKESSMFAYELAPQVMTEVEKVLSQLGNTDAITIPNTLGQVLVREGTDEFESRFQKGNIVMVPVKKGDELFYVCSK